MLYIICIPEWSTCILLLTTYLMYSDWNHDCKPYKLNTLDLNNTETVTYHTLRPSQNGRHFADAIFECIFMNENVWISLKISLKFVLKVELTIFQHWFRWWLGDKPLSAHVMVNILTHISVTRPQWVKSRQFEFMNRRKRLTDIQWISPVMLTYLRSPSIWCCHYLPPGSLSTLGASESLSYSHVSFNLI